jgi:hypothetical protein
VFALVVAGSVQIELVYESRTIGTKSVIVFEIVILTVTAVDELFVVARMNMVCDGDAPPCRCHHLCRWLKRDESSTSHKSFNATSYGLDVDRFWKYHRHDWQMTLVQVFLSTIVAGLMLCMFRAEARL